MGKTRDSTFGEELQRQIDLHFKSHAALARWLGFTRGWIGHLVNDYYDELSRPKAMKVIEAFPVESQKPLFDAWQRDFGSYPEDETLVTAHSKNEDVLTYLGSMPAHSQSGRLNHFCHVLRSIWNGMPNTGERSQTKFEVGHKLVEALCYSGKPLLAEKASKSLMNLAGHLREIRMIAHAKWLKGVTRRYREPYDGELEKGHFEELDEYLEAWVPQTKAELQEHRQMTLSSKRSQLVVALDSGPVATMDAGVAYRSFQPHIDTVSHRDEYALNKDVEARYHISVREFAKAERAIADSKKQGGPQDEMHQVRVMVTEVKFLMEDACPHEAADKLYDAMSTAEERGLYLYQGQLKKLEACVLRDIDDRKKRRGA